MDEKNKIQIGGTIKNIIKKDISTIKEIYLYQVNLDIYFTK